MAELRTGVYRATGKPTIRVQEQVGPMVLYRFGTIERLRCGLAGAIAADLELGGYTWSER